MVMNCIVLYSQLNDIKSKELIIHQGIQLIDSEI